jgi:hypothetical protein
MVKALISSREIHFMFLHNDLNATNNEACNKDNFMTAFPRCRLEDSRDPKPISFKVNKGHLKLVSFCCTGFTDVYSHVLERMSCVYCAFRATRTHKR